MNFRATIALVGEISQGLSLCLTVNLSQTEGMSVLLPRAHGSIAALQAWCTGNSRYVVWAPSVSSCFLRYTDTQTWYSPSSTTHWERAQFTPDI